MESTLDRGVSLNTAGPAAINRRTRTKFHSIEQIRVSEILEMHQVFTQYYANADLGTFFRDLSKKDGAFIVRDRKSGRIKGFSTLKKLKIPFGKRDVVGYFSGDTILERDIWGGTQFQSAFTRYMLRAKLRYLGRPVYWFLISKGYKTYLLLANNFLSYYPRYDRPTDSPLRELVVAYCKRLFPDNYNARTGLLEFGDNAQHLHADVAPITDELRQRYPKIRFFEQVNPTWQQGTELPCVGEITMHTIVRAALKQLRKRISRAASARGTGRALRPAAETGREGG